jgi:DNA modification methylase
VPEEEYPAFTVEWMAKLWPKLVEDGSVLIVIDPHVKDGELSDYVLRTQIALRQFGWKQHMPLMWLKGDRGPQGHTGWLRHAYEQVLWFSKTTKPFCDPKAGGEETEVEAPRYRHSRWSPGGKSARGIKRASDVIDIPVGLTPKGVDHPAMFPIELAEFLIRHYCRPGGTVWDGFAGSGNSLLAAARLGHDFNGCDLVPEYVDLARRRLAEAGAMPKAG